MKYSAIEAPMPRLAPVTMTWRLIGRSPEARRSDAGAYWRLERTDAFGESVRTPLGGISMVVVTDSGRRAYGVEELDR
jgi:hypothetical protein